MAHRECLSVLKSEKPWPQASVWVLRHFSRFSFAAGMWDQTFWSYSGQLFIIISHLVWSCNYHSRLFYFDMYAISLIVLQPYFWYQWVDSFPGNTGTVENVVLKITQQNIKMHFLQKLMAQYVKKVKSGVGLFYCWDNVLTKLWGRLMRSFPAYAQPFNSLDVRICFCEILPDFRITSFWKKCVLIFCFTVFRVLPFIGNDSILNNR